MNKIKEKFLDIKLGRYTTMIGNYFKEILELEEAYGPSYKQIKEDGRYWQQYKDLHYKMFDLMVKSGHILSKLGKVKEYRRLCVNIGKMAHTLDDFGKLD